MGATPSGLVTLLFTDIEGSTRAWDSHPVEMQTALRRHDALLGATAREHGGYVFKTVGDAFCIAFADPDAAVAAAVDAQQHLGREPWPAPTPIRVRMAIHSGTCEERDGDYFGPTVNRVARLLALAHGGQVVVSAATAALVSSSGRGNFTLRDLGAHALKDMDRAERVSQVLAPALEADFPPLRSVQGGRHNLPEPITSFVGRRRELERLAALIPQARAVTLVGPGGAGKTRLAFEAGAAALDARRDGVWFVDLSSVLDPGDVDAAIAASVRVPEQPGRQPMAAVVQALRAQDALLIFDNCEHLVGAAAAAAGELLRSCPRVTVLSTSREPLGVRGEHVFRLEPLSTPEPDEDLPRLVEHEAVRLFAERVRLHEPAFELSEAVAGTVARICRRLDGIPLALELAAARTRAASVDELDARLDDRFRVLRGGDRSLPARQQTLYATVDWSFNLLGAPERLLLCRLAVFVGGWNTTAAEAVCAGDDIDGDDVWELLTSLVDKSMVQVTKRQGLVRYRLLDTIRAYAAERVAEGDPDGFLRVRSRHLDHYVAVAESAAAELDGVLARDALDVFASEHENVRAALEASLDIGDMAQGLRLAVATAGFWRASGLARETAEWLPTFLERDREEAEPLLRGRAELLLGGALMQLAKYSDARVHLGVALRIGWDERDPTLIVQSLAQLSFISYLDGDGTESVALAHEAVSVARPSGEAELLALALAREADGYDALGAIERTRALLEEALAVARGGGNQRLLATMLNNSGEAALHFEDFETARHRFEEAITLGEATGDAPLLAYAKRNLGTVLVLVGDGSAAEAVLDDALVLAERTGAPVGFAYGLLARALAASALGEPLKAATLHGVADALFDEIATSPEPLETRLRDSDRAALRAQLGDREFEETYQRGRTLPRSDVLKTALSRGRFSSHDGG